MTQARRSGRMSAVAVRTLAGAPAAEPRMAEGSFVEVVRAYRERRLGNAVMQGIAARLADDEIASLAYYFATESKS